MTTKDYQAIAGAIKAELDCCRLDECEDIQRRTVYSLCKSIGKIFAADNPQFDRDRFERACGFDN